MKNTLELKDVIGYIPYGLKLCNSKEFIEYITDAVGCSDGNLNFRSEYGICKKVDGDKVNPILRPLSDLYKTITHNGKNIVPIIECSKIAMPLQKYKIIDNVFVKIMTEKNRNDFKFYYSVKTFRMFSYFL
jgi:hypothetical protein